MSKSFAGVAVLLAVALVPGCAVWMTQREIGARRLVGLDVESMVTPNGPATTPHMAPHHWKQKKDAAPAPAPAAQLDVSRCFLVPSLPVHAGKCEPCVPCPPVDAKTLPQTVPHLQTGS